MEDEEAFLDLQLNSEPTADAQTELDRWAQIEADIVQQQQDELTRRAAERGDHPEGEGSAQDSDGSDDDQEDVNGWGSPDHKEGGGDEDFSDEQLLAVEHKKEAKQLGKVLYKRWKKLHKRHHSSDKDKKKKKSGKKEKRKPSKRESASKPKKSRKSNAASGEKTTKRRKRAAEADSMDDIPFMTDEEANRLLMMGGAATSGTLGVDAARRTAAGARQGASGTDGAKRLTGAQQRDLNAQIAVKLVDEMRRAAKADENALAHPKPGVSPLFRIALCEKVNSLCRRECLYGPLIEAGVLQELSQWLYCIPRNEPAPLELRTVALDVLLNFPIAGEVRPKEEKRNRNGEVVSINVDQFLGIDWEHLRETDLGVSVNSLRQHANEMTANRSKCIRLLERLSRARHHDEDNEGGRASSGPAQVHWRTKGDPTIASPFVTVQTGSEAFQKAIMKPDPRDPTSYDNYLPWRPTAVPVTNLSGDLLERATGRVGDIAKESKAS